MRLRSDIWVAGLIRRAEVSGASAYLRRRGAAEAGAIVIVVDRLDGRQAIFGAAPQSEDLAPGIDRLFMRIHREEWLDGAGVEARLAREIGFDGDVWIVSLEDRIERLPFDAV